MRFKIRYADQIVGLLAVSAIALLLLLVLLLGSKQRWFAKDYAYTAVFETSAGLSEGMAIQYKGFTVGKIKRITLNEDDEVDVALVVYDTYANRVTEGTLIELITNPIGLSNQLLLHPGRGSEPIKEGSRIPRADSPEGRLLVSRGVAYVPPRDDTINSLIAQLNPILSNLNGTLGQLNGTSPGPLNDTLTSVAGITTELESSLSGILANVQGITTNLERASADSKGLVPALIDPDGTMFANVEATFGSLAGTLDNVEASTAILKSQMPQIARLVEDLRLALGKGQDVLEALKNNPLLRNGVPERAQSDSSGTNSRNIEF